MLDALARPGTVTRFPSDVPGVVRLRIDAMAVVHQDPAVGLDLRVSAGGNIAERLTAAGWRGYRAIRRRAAKLLDRVEVPLSRMDDPVHTFSGGERQRVNLAAGTVRPPRLLLLDEPVSALDPANREAALELVDSLAGQGVAVLAVFHDMDAIRRLASRVVFVGDGRIARQGAPDRMLEAAA
ncbi:ATP-binding cassette domain-containing protein [Streptomyces violaceusniger]|uniref:ABC transporter domain-containing protein n=1 Tax=Streptomyces violaceusniger TaxID=68280 RepID=A0A4D4KNP5_STRVO|nr:hypothetical protein SVIO_009150 [Streptomyces violaceusniger]